MGSIEQPTSWSSPLLSSPPSRINVITSANQKCSTHLDRLAPHYPRHLPTLICPFHVKSSYNQQCSFIDIAYKENFSVNFLSLQMSNQTSCATLMLLSAAVTQTKLFSSFTKERPVITCWGIVHRIHPLVHQYIHSSLAMPPEIPTSLPQEYKNP